MACQWIADCQLGPSFLGYMAEEGNVIVFIMACIIDCRHAKVEDFAPYQLASSNLHKLGIKYVISTSITDFLIHDREAIFIDFESALRLPS